MNVRYSEDIEMDDNEISADQTIFKFIPPSDLSSDQEMTPSGMNMYYILRLPNYFRWLEIRTFSTSQRRNTCAKD